MVVYYPGDPRPVCDGIRDETQFRTSQTANSGKMGGCVAGRRRYSPLSLFKQRNEGLNLVPRDLREFSNLLTRH